MLKFTVRNPGVLAVLIFIGLFIASLVGWVWNIVKMTGMDFAAETAMFIVRAIGIFVAPLGAVLGYL